MPRSATVVLCCGILAACAAPRPGPATDPAAPGSPEHFPSTYEPLPSTPVLITNATILTGDGKRLDAASILLRDGRIEAVGPNLRAPADAHVVDGSGKWVTPGIIDNHSHLGVYATPAVAAHSDGNEMSGPNTAEVWAEHAVWPQDPGFDAARAGGVTTMQVLPGSANLFGGRTVTLKNVPARTTQAMKFPGAPQGLKMACGENPKRLYGSRQAFPMTRMGDVAGYRMAFSKAFDYREKWRAWADGTVTARPDRDLQLETLVAVLEGEILVHHHCYRADEMAQVLDVAREFGYRVSSFHHATEAYKIGDLLAASDVCASIWADWWGFKLEAWDGIRENAALLHAAGACVVVHSDSDTGIQRLNQEAAKAMASGRNMGIDIDEGEAIRWLTANPARTLGIADRTGTLVPGMMADVVVWDGNPFSVYTRAEKVYIDGALAYDRSDAARQPKSDFMLGIIETTGGLQ
ncbi:MAG TPA: amidohydrolase [Gammaproteobacteria bacterium]|nr:amidohydrolase [Gammaproteobacteria bacterium]